MTGRWRRITALGIAAIIALLMVHYYGCGWLGERISWSCLRWSNYDRFNAQLHSDIPTGTRQEAVEAYLSREGIPYSYDFPRSPSYRKPIVFSKDMPMSWGNPFGGSMQVYVVFDHEGGVAEIETHRQAK